MTPSRFGYSSRLFPGLKSSLFDQQPVYTAQTVHKCLFHASCDNEASRNSNIDTQYSNWLCRSLNTQMLSSVSLRWLPMQFCGIRTFHTNSCLQSSRTQHLLSSRRGRFSNLEDARQYVASLTAVQRTTLEHALQEAKPDTKAEDVSEDGAVEVPSRNQLKLLCYQSALPFIGFGFLDNVIMITVGEYIDWTLGMTLGISTMAAAGLGNMISDLAGLGLADQVEAFCLRLGIPNPNLSSSQLKHKSARWTILLGRCIGIAIGCIIGMAPLYWIDDPHKKDCEHTGNGK